jgi:SET domain-containing protein
VVRTRVILFPPDESDLLSRTRLKHYLFYVRDGAGDVPPYHTALAMGPVSFCNHSGDPNCDFRVDEAAAEVILTARRRLRRNEEITIDYGDYADEVI